MTGSPAGLAVAAYQPDMAESWDRLVGEAAAGTVLHARRFLDYHGSRFAELSTVLQDNDGKLLGVFPVVASPREPDLAVSHAGSSFGGVVATPLDILPKWVLLRETARGLCASGYRRLRYKTTPLPCLRAPDDALLPALLRCGTVVACDLWPIIIIDSPFAQRRIWQREIRRGGHKELAIAPVSGADDWQEFHEVIDGRLRGKFGVQPAHTAAELLDLERRLGDRQIGLIVRKPNGAAVAALWFLDYGTGTLHMQYSATTEEGLHLGAAPFAISQILEMATARGWRNLSLGRSTEPDGWSVNRGLLRFKQKFGASLAAQLHIDIDLAACAGLPDDALVRGL